MSATGDAYLLPASFAQDRLWLLHQLAPTATAYHLAAGVRLRGPLDVDLLRGCLRRVVARHEALRTTFGAGAQGALTQVVRDGVPVELPLRDLLGQRPHATAAELDALARARAAELAAAPFDLAAGPLLRVELLRVAADEHLLVFCAHHIVVDGISLTLVLAEIGELYRAGRAGMRPALAELPVQYADWAAWQREWLAGPQAREGIEHWRAALVGASALELPTDAPRGALAGRHGGELPLTVPADLAAGMRRLAAAERCTPFMVLTAALAAAASRWSRQEDLVVGTPVAGRTVPEAQRLVGCFVNTLPLRVDLSGRPTFRRLLARVRQTCLHAYAHQQVPYEQLVELAGCSGRRPLVRTLLAMRPMPGPAWPGVPELTVETFPVPTGGTQFELAGYLHPTPDGGLAGEWVYDADLFAPPTVEAFGEGLLTFLAAAVADPDAPVGRLPVMRATARRSLREERSGAAVAPVADGLLHHAFERYAARCPDAPAVVDPAGGSAGGEPDATGALTYGELDRRANRLAWVLRESGVRAGDLVGVCLPRGVPMVVSILATLKAGAAYVPLDPGYPAERVRFMLDDSGARVVLTDAATAAGPVLRGAATRPLELDTEAGAIATAPAGPPPVAVTPRHLAYVIYTSGSTGRPKGAMNEHRAVTNRIAWMQRHFGLAPGEGVVQKTPLSFDVSGWEVHWPLAVGGRLVLARPEGHRDPEYLADLIVAERISTVHFVPSMLRAFLSVPAARRAAPVLRRLVCSGEELHRDLADQVARVLPGVGLHNLYGPTEAAIDVTAYDVLGGGAGRVPIGRPIAGAHTYLLDADGDLAPPGAPGELCLGGVAVGRGYHGRPGLTAQRFRPDPFRPGGRLYRTGDLARWRPDGELEFLGRIDHQVKIRGHRIETAEIESVLAGHPDVGSAAVVPVDDGTGDTWLAAYVTPAPAAAPTAGPAGAIGGAGSAGRSAAADSGELRRYLRERLPEVMVPAVVVRLDALPCSPSGKLDRTRLPPPRPAVPAGPSAPPGTPVEETLAAIWRDVLGLGQVGVEDDFYDLGGNSLRAVTVLNRARDAGLLVPVALLLGNHTIRDLAGVAVAVAAGASG